MSSKEVRLVKYLGVFTIACLALSFSRYAYSGTVRHLYLPWNLLLAFVPIVFALLAKKTKTDIKFWVFFVLWLLFLPNAFYIVTDLIHLNPIEANLEGYRVGNYRYANEANSPGILFDAVLLFMYSAFGFLMGLISTEIAHKRLAKLVKPRLALAMVISSLVLSGFAIYLGRTLRWNSWDAATNPGQLTKDIFNIFVHPEANAEAWAVTGMFSFLAISMYLLYRSLRSL